MDPPPALASLRTVQFRQSLRGYNCDDVDRYLEQVVIEAEGLHHELQLAREQLRQATEQLQQSGERIAQLEGRIEQQPPPSAPTAVPDDPPRW